MGLSFKPEDFERMKFIETDVAQLLFKYRENTEAALVIFACVRCARTLLRLYPPETQAWMFEVLRDFLAAPSGTENDDVSRIQRLM